jgi:hypothetical protein
MVPAFAFADDAAGTSSGQQQSQQQSGDRNSARQSQGNQSDQQAPDGFVIVDERVITLTANEPQNHFLRAHEFLNRNDTRGAAAEIRIAAGYLDMQASRDKGQDRQSLSSAADQLRNVADQLKNGQGQPAQQAGSQQGQQAQQGQQSAQQQQAQQQQSQQSQQQTAQSGQQEQVTQAFASANHALAEHFQRLAKHELQSKKAIMAGHDLDAAASALRASCAWSGQKPDQEARSAIQDAQRVAFELISHEPMNAQAQSQTGDQSTSSNASSDDEAQPAGARIGSSEQHQQGNHAQSQMIPQDAQKAVDQLGQAIQKLSSKVGDQTHSSGQSSGQSNANSSEKKDSSNSK